MYKISGENNKKSVEQRRHFWSLAVSCFWITCVSIFCQRLKISFWDDVKLWSHISSRKWWKNQSKIRIFATDFWKIFRSVSDSESCFRALAFRQMLDIALRKLQLDSKSVTKNALFQNRVYFYTLYCLINSESFTNPCGKPTHLTPNKPKHFKQQQRSILSSKIRICPGTKLSKNCAKV